MFFIISIKYGLLTLTHMNSMRLPHFLSGTALSFVLGCLPWSDCPGQAVNLDFSNPVGSPNGNYSLGPYFSSSVISFTNVATVGGQSVDMRATATVFGSGYTFQGHFADYSESSGQPNGDLGNRYIASSYGAGGLNYTLNFYLGGSNFTTAFTLTEFDLLLYDVDGENSGAAEQTEAFRAYLSDGLTSYRLADSPNSVTATNFTGGILFNGPGFNVDEDDPSGAVLLTYKNTSSVTLRFEANTIDGALPNGVFTAIDGDKSIIGGNTSDFNPPVAVPEPSGALLLMLAGFVQITTRRRRK